MTNTGLVYSSRVKSGDVIKVSLLASQKSSDSSYWLVIGCYYQVIPTERYRVTVRGQVTKTLILLRSHVIKSTMLLDANITDVILCSCYCSVTGGYPQSNWSCDLYLCYDWLVLRSCDLFHLICYWSITEK